MAKITLLLLAAFIVAIAAACSGDIAATPTPQATPTVQATSLPTVTAQPAASPTVAAGPFAVDIASFAHLNVSVPKGTTVEWTNKDTAAHTVTSGEPGKKSGLFNSGNIAAGGKFSQAFAQTGSFPYFCEIHTGMKAIVTVTDGGVPSVSPSSAVPSYDDEYTYP